MEILRSPVLAHPSLAILPIAATTTLIIYQLFKFFCCCYVCYIRYWSQVPYLVNKPISHWEFLKNYFSFWRYFKFVRLLCFYSGLGKTLPCIYYYRQTPHSTILDSTDFKIIWLLLKYVFFKNLFLEEWNSVELDISSHQN